MKRLSEYISPLSWLLLLQTCYTAIAVLLSPSLLEFLVFLFAEFAALPVIVPIEQKLFLRLNPSSDLYLRDIKENEIATMGSGGRSDVLTSMMRFPTRRAAWCFLLSFVKIIPSTLVIVFFWKHPTRSNLSQFAMVAGMALVNFSYFYGVTFIESHRFLSKVIADLHAKHDFSEAFRITPIQYSKRDFEIQEQISLLALFFSGVVLLTTIILANKSQSSSTLAFHVALVATTGIILFMRIWYLGRSFFIGGLETLFGTMNRTDYQRAPIVLPLHTSPLLAKFESTFNSLVGRLRKSEQEVAALVVQEAEKSRYRALGEISALVAHDLSGPLHIVRFCVEQLREDPTRLSDKRYSEHLWENVTRSIELIDSLRARLKDPSPDHSYCAFMDAHKNVVRLLKTQFGSEAFDSVTILLNPDLDSLVLGISRVDLIHALDNIYRNAIQNMLENGVENPTLNVFVDELNSKDVDIFVRDNGTGLPAEEFERLTAYRFASERTPNCQMSCLGLRLTRRLVELNGGTLSVIPHDGTAGTTIRLRLKKSEYAATGLVIEPSTRGDVSEVI